VLGGWYLAAYERELSGELTPVSIHGMPLVIVNDGERLRAFDSVCPHRGANLAYGGELVDGAIICPFHANRVNLGLEEGRRYCVREFPLLGYGGLLFVRLSDEFENGLEAFLDGLAEGHFFVPGFGMTVTAPAPIVIENAFDESHFRPVHGVSNEPEFTIRPSEHGEFAVEGVFEVPPSVWQRSGNGEANTVTAPFVARAFSPHLVISELGGSHPYVVITGATPLDKHQTRVRVSLAVPPEADGAPPDAELCRYLLRQAESGIATDATIWEHLSFDMEPSLSPQDTAVVEFERFCERFKGLRAS
jgi:3-ketosteroid 9alpha-monooxygenase subunit A